MEINIIENYIINIIDPVFIDKLYKKEKVNNKNLTLIIQYSKMVKNHNVYFYFQMDSKNPNSFDFYANSIGKGRKIIVQKHPYLFDDDYSMNNSWKFNTENELKDILENLKELILNESLTWAEDIQSVDIDYTQFVLNQSEKKLNKLGFYYSVENSGNRYIYESTIRSLSSIDKILLITFLRKQTAFFDVVRFEVCESSLTLFVRLLFYPELKKSNQIFLNQLNESENLFNINNEIEIQKTLNNKYEIIVNKGIGWLNDNRPIKNQNNHQNMGIFPDKKSIDKILRYMENK